ncbi:GTPase HflX [bacterium C-53]|nr:GTPase HflX [Lachnospiraceae bacterium]NBI04401.1 GTPase HflX [Lachnospiraceae bacterium]RKJ08296.1 GTPase HflX [bacterium C-53]
METCDICMEKVILIGIGVSEESLDELSELVKTAGGQETGRMVQTRDSAQAGTYFGSGKLVELSEMVEERGATGVVCDDELTPAQLRNMEQALQTKIMDRTLVILDIFAARALTAEGKIQVELAQLKYRLTRLVGLRDSLSRLGGGIGTRGPGEKKLEMDRRLVKNRIASLNRELKEVKCHREVTRQQREKSGIPVAAIVGYTNAGKSTLLNRLTGAQVLSEDKLFATLDPTTRAMALPSGQQTLLTDTVGFIQKLPHHLIDAFRSTLEEAKYADVIIHVVDQSNPSFETQMHIVYDTLKELGVEEKPVLTLFNKADAVHEEGILRDFRAQKALSVSAKTGENIEEAKLSLEDVLRGNRRLLERVFPYSEAGTIQYVRRYGELLQEKYEENGIYIKAYVPAKWYDKVAK